MACLVVRYAQYYKGNLKYHLILLAHYSSGIMHGILSVKFKYFLFIGPEFEPGLVWFFCKFCCCQLFLQAYVQHLQVNNAIQQNFCLLRSYHYNDTNDRQINILAQYRGIHVFYLLNIFIQYIRVFDVYLKAMFYRFILRKNNI